MSQPDHARQSNTSELLVIADRSVFDFVITDDSTRSETTADGGGGGDVRWMREIQ
jgi:hypothetical protein